MQAKSSRRGAPVKVTDFTLAVIKTVKRIPRGKVATYAQIARLAGKPGAARGVGWILNSSSEKNELPWQRVINSQGSISFPQKSAEFKLQKKLLQAEGIEFHTSKALDLDLYQWKKDAVDKRKKNEPSMFSGKSRK
jgi:methylated-DNA-protein-cysteine methyltransferase related protein